MSHFNLCRGDAILPAELGLVRRTIGDERAPPPNEVREIGADPRDPGWWCAVPTDEIEFDDVCVAAQRHLRVGGNIRETRLGRFLVAAHSLGLEVVIWYPGVDARLDEIPATEDVDEALSLAAECLRTEIGDIYLRLVGERGI